MTPSPILVDRSTLAAPTGEDLSLVGGEIDVDEGNLTAPAAELNLLALDEGEARIADGALTGSRADIAISDSHIETRTKNVPGTIRISGDQVRIIDQSVVSAPDLTDPFGSDGSFIIGEGGGSIMIDASDLVVDNASIAASAGFFPDGGDVSLRSDRIRIINQSTIEAAGGMAGSITIAASELTVDDASIEAIGPSGGGAIRIDANRTRIANQAALRVGGGAAFPGVGIAIGVSEMVLDDASIGATGLAGGGPITISADRLIIRDGRIDSTSPGGPIPTSGGDILITVTNRLELENAAVATEGNLARGGRIGIAVGDLLDVRGSSITTSASGPGPTSNSDLPPLPTSDAGDITIGSGFVLLEGSRIIARATEGTGGNIRITADNLLVPEGDVQKLLDEGAISASAGPAGIDGTIVISSPDVDLAGGLVVLEGALVDGASLLRERCAARGGEELSSFTPVGHGGLPPSPDRPLMSTYLMAGEVDEAQAHEALAPERRLASLPRSALLSCR